VISKKASKEVSK